MKKYIARSCSEDIQAAICEIFMEMQPKLTVRQVYYALTIRKDVPKTEAGYRQVCYQLKKMREQGIIPYGWIADNTHYCCKPVSDYSLEASLYRLEQSFLEDLWDNQDDHVEIWVHKDALAGVISPITKDYGVPLVVKRGYSSQTLVYEAAEEIKRLGKKAYIYHFGDHDPSGVDTAVQIEMGLWMHGVFVNFERIAITENQINIYDLPSCDIKPNDPRSKTWGDKPCVELDALPAPILRDLVRTCIERHIDPTELKKERETVAAIHRNLLQAEKSLFGGAAW